MFCVLCAKKQISAMPTIQRAQPDDSCSCSWQLDLFLLTVTTLPSWAHTKILGNTDNKYHFNQQHKVFPVLRIISAYQHDLT